MIEIKKINNEIDFIIEKNKYFFLRCCNLLKINEFDKFTEFIKYSLIKEYTVIKADYKDDIVFFMIPKKKDKKMNQLVYKMIDRLIEIDENVFIEIVNADKINKNKTKKNEIKLRDESKQWFNEM